MPKHTVVRVEPAKLEKFVGKYVVPANVQVVLTIERSGDHLTVQENEEPEQALMPESELQFFDGVRHVYRFELDAGPRYSAI